MSERYLGENPTTFGWEAGHWDDAATHDERMESMAHAVVAYSVDDVIRAIEEGGR